MVSAALLTTLIAGQAAARPNIVLILADDLGYGSLGCYGETQIPTPNIDSLAKNGVRMTDGYVTCPVCSPTRAGLLTGRYQQRFGHELNPGLQQAASEKFGIAASEQLLPEVLAKNGYRTGMVGKWHLGYQKGFTPTERGFGSFYGFLGGAHSYLPGAGSRGILREGEPVRESEYLTDAFARESVAFIKTQDKRPFFLYLAFNAVHSPLQAPDDYTKDFSQLRQKRKTFAGMLTGLDRAVGRVLDTLKERKVEENTLVVFLSDNGGPTQQTTSKNGPLRGVKGQVYEGGVRVPFIMQWKSKAAPGRSASEPCLSLDLFPTFLEAAGIPAQAARPGLEGRSLMPLLMGEKSSSPSRPLFWRFGSQHAVRSGDWKLVVRQNAQPELYQLTEDIGEAKDLSKAEPEKLDQLQKLYADWDKSNIPPAWKRG